MQHITLSAEPHTQHSPSLFLRSKYRTWRDSPRMFVLSRLTLPLWCAAAALHWAIHVTFNLHVAAYSFEVSGGLHTRAQKFFLLLKTLTYWRFTFQLVHKSWSSGWQTQWAGESQQSVLFWERKLFYFPFIFIL